MYEQTGYALATAVQQRHVAGQQHLLAVLGRHHPVRPHDRLSAPGEADWAVCDAAATSPAARPSNPSHHFVEIQAFGGTSQSAPITAGVAALVIQAYRKTHGGTSPTPAVVKQIITSTARDLGLPGDEQGSGLIDARAAVEAALTWPGATSAAPAGTGRPTSRCRPTS